MNNRHNKSSNSFTDRKLVTSLGTLKMTKEEMEATFPRYPSDGNGFLECYETNQPELYLPVLQKYGFVVIQLLTPEECDETLNEFLQDANANPEGKQEKKIDLEDPNTWENVNWPAPNSKFLFRDKACGQKVFDNRSHPKLHEFYRNVYGTEKLWCAMDPWGLMRGTKNLRMEGKRGRVSTVEKSEWRTELKMHWDCNPWNYELELSKGHHAMHQGLVAIVDCPEEVGGFLCVPGSTAFLKEWIKHNRPDDPDPFSIQVPLDDPMLAYQQRVPLKRGQMVVWDSGQAHANFANQSSKPRIVQFLRMAAVCDNVDCKSHRFLAKNILKDTYYMNMLKERVKLTPLGRLAGFTSWDQ